MEILNLSLRNSLKIIKKAVGIIRKGGVIVFPTDTVYGLLAEATDKRAVEKIFKIKKRQGNKWLPLFVKDLKSVKKLAKIDKKQEKFLESVWPGKTTVVLKRKKGIKLYGVDKETIALRIPNYPLLNKLLKQINKPLVQTSTNISGKKPLNKPKEIIEEFKGNKPDLMISDNRVKSGKQSRLVDITGSKINVLRK